MRFRDYLDEDFMDKQIKIKVPAAKMRNPYALDAMTRKADKFRDRREKRRNNPKRCDWNY
jgi:hypothetical protein